MYIIQRLKTTLFFFFHAIFLLKLSKFSLSHPLKKCWKIKELFERKGGGKSHNEDDGIKNRKNSRENGFIFVLIFI